MARHSQSRDDSGVLRVQLHVVLKAHGALKSMKMIRTYISPHELPFSPLPPSKPRLVC